MIITKRNIILDGCIVPLCLRCTVKYENTHEKLQLYEVTFLRINVKMNFELCQISDEDAALISLKLENNK
jgi:hypothetical protein